jgi:hypothetical protein
MTSFTQGFQLHHYQAWFNSKEYLLALWGKTLTLSKFKQHFERKGRKGSRKGAKQEQELKLLALTLIDLAGDFDAA